jgi:DNA-binding NtrC family response regulator
MAKILSVGPDHDILAARNRELRGYGHHVRSAETRADALYLARSGVFEVILICDQFLPAYAAQLADELQQAAPRTTILVLAGHSSPLRSGEIHTLIVEQVPLPAAA